MKKILFVAPWVPSSERPRSMGILQMLSTDFEVHVVAATWSEREQELAKKLPAASVTRVRMSKIAALSRVSRALFSRQSLQQAYVDSRSLRAAIERVDAEVRPDVAYFNVIRSAHLVDSTSGQSYRVLDMDEFRSDYYAQLSERSRSLRWRTIGVLERARMKRAEVAARSAFDRILVSSPIDLKIESTPSTLRLVRSPHALGESGADLEVQREPRTILFVGRMSYSANVQGIKWFVTEVMPVLLRRVPDVRLKIVGSDPTPEVMRLQSESVEVLGRVPEVAPFYRAASVAVVPIELATGVQMKLIEALYCGAPTVSTPLCAAQAGIKHDRECLTASTREEWVEAIVALLEDQGRAGKIADAGAVWASKNYSRRAIEASLWEALEESGSE